MKKILVLGSLSTQTGETNALQEMANFVKSSIDNAAVYENEVVFCHLDEVGYVVGNHERQMLDLRNGRDLKNYDLVFFRGKIAQLLHVAATVAQYLEEHNVPQINTAYKTRRAIGKLPQIYHLAKLGMPIPKTISASSRYLPDLVAGKLDFPMVVKDIKGAHGNSNYLVKDAAELQAILKNNPNLEFMAQEYIPNDGDYRILFVGNEVRVIRRQGSADSHLNNTSTGAQASLVDTNSLEPIIIEQSQQFATFCEYEIAGVDVIINRETNQYYFLEINSQPQLASGAFIDIKRGILGKYLTELLERSV